MKLKFCGAAETVTGSCHMLECSGKKILVDCGMRQGQDKKGELGEDKFLFSPTEIDAVLLTHAHIDHSGLIPLLVKQGYKGPIISTTATEQLSTIMLPDAAHIQEQDAETTNRKLMRAGKPQIEPLFCMEDAENALKLFRPVSYGEVVQLFPEIKVRFTDVGHLLGSAAIEIWAEENGKTVKLAFSGDLGRIDRPIIRDPQAIESADFMIMEGTYGDRKHEICSDAEKEAELASILSEGIARGGNIVIPSFAVGRTQELMYYIKKMLAENTVPGLENIPVYIDSPMAINATSVYEQCSREYYDDQALSLSEKGTLLDFPTLRIAASSDESKQINLTDGCKIIISSSGMCDAGRIRHHLKHNLYRKDSTVVFAGYQAVGTLGRTLTDGADSVKMFGEEINVAANIVNTKGFSGHADHDELINWLGKLQNKPTKVFLVHGEKEVLELLGKDISSLGYDLEIPFLGEEFDLDTMTASERPVVVQSATAPEEKAEAKVVDKKPANKTFEVPEATVTNLDELLPGTGILDQLGKLAELMDGVSDRRSPDMTLKFSIMEEDLKSLYDKWEKIFNVK